jgi:hypothetical protein
MKKEKAIKVGSYKDINIYLLSDKTFHCKELSHENLYNDLTLRSKSYDEIKLKIDRFLANKSFVPFIAIHMDCDKEITITHVREDGRIVAKNDKGNIILLYENEYRCYMVKTETNNAVTKKIHQANADLADCENKISLLRRKRNALYEALNVTTITEHIKFQIEKK